jgi:divinyl chlorophyllide a 8-vinyl-reductase
LNTYREGRKAGVAHYVLLSAICVQRPLLEFQKAKLAFETELQADGEMSYSIVRPTAFFKSLGGQVESCRKGGPYVMFGGGTLASCKPISEADLARFMADCITDPDKRNQVLPIGGPGPAMSAREQGEMLFRALGRQQRMLSVPIALMDGPIALLEGLSRLFPGLQDTAEFGRIGRYYASESMLVWDAQEERYDADATPSYGEDTLEQFFERVVRDGMAGQDLGDASVF